MAILSLQNFNTMVQNFSSGVQGACKYLVDFSTGSILLSVAEANSAVGLWMQWLILQVLNVTRLATSFNGDVDSFVNDYSLTRLPATFATGQVTFSRFTPTSQAVIQPGSLVKTGDGTQQFVVIADATQSAWNATLSCYVIPSSTSSAVVTVEAQNPGTQGNVQAGTITLLASAIPFVDSVTNAANFNNGINAQSDASLKASFSSYIQTRSKGTIAAVSYAISSVQQGVTSSINENISLIGVYTPGHFVAVVDDGSGAPPAGLIAEIGAAIAAYRPLCSTWDVVAPSITTATITLNITTNPVGNKYSLLTPVNQAIVAYVNSIPDGSTLTYSRIAGVAYSVDASIVSVEAVLINGVAADLVPVQFGGIKATFASVTVS